MKSTQKPKDLFSREEYVKMYAAIFKSLNQKGYPIDLEDENFLKIKAEMTPEEQKYLEAILEEAKTLSKAWEEEEE